MRSRTVLSVFAVLSVSCAATALLLLLAGRAPSTSSTAPAILYTSGYQFIAGARYHLLEAGVPLLQPYSSSKPGAGRPCQPSHLLAWKLKGDGWDYMAQQKRGLPKDSTFRHLNVSQLQQQLPVWVLNMKGATQRRQHMVQALEAAGISEYKFKQGLNGSDPGAVSKEEMEFYFTGVAAEAWHKGDIKWRRKIAADISHFRILQEIVARRATALVFEDDGGPVKDLYQHLLPVLQDLPCDWDLLFLTACFLEQGPTITTRLTSLKSAHCLVGYLPSLHFAARALAYRRAHPDMQQHPIDVQFNLMMVELRAAAYMPVPPLAYFGTGMPSIIEQPPPPQQN
jgi:GR25 family glycosyltransferase involved in LPS biosynthesis